MVVKVAEVDLGQKLIMRFTETKLGIFHPVEVVLVIRSHEQDKEDASKLIS